MNDEDRIKCGECAACYEICDRWGMCRLHGENGAWVKMSDPCYRGFSEEDARQEQILIEP